MKLIRIQPSKIKIPELRVTSVFTEEKEELLKEYLAQTGVIAPIVVQETDGELWLVDGKHRVDELIIAGDHPVEAAVIEGDQVDLLTRNLFLDHIRGEHKVGDMIRVLKTLSEYHGLDVEALERKTGLSRSYIEKILIVGKASAAVLEALDQGVIGVSHAFEIARLPSQVQQEELLAKQQVFRFPVKELKGFIDTVLREMDLMAKEEPPTGPAEEPTPRVYHCEGCKQEVEAKYLRPVMVCPTCFGHVFRLGQSATAEAQEDEKET